MKILTKLALAAVLFTTAVSAQAEWVSGHFRSNGTYVDGYYRTPANDTPYDNLSYRGYPSQQPGYFSPRSRCFDSDYSQPSYGYNRIRTLPSYDDLGGGLQTLPSTRRNYKTRTYDF